jgi:hypothetical protein
MLKKSLLAFVVVIVVFSVWIAWEFITDAPPQFFPLDNPKGEYRLTKMCPNGQGWNNSLYSQDKGYSIEYTGTGIFMSQDQANSSFYRICVGKSSVDLEPIMGKKIKKITGDFVSSSKQCVLDRCIEIGGPLVVLNIEKIEMTQ